MMKTTNGPQRVNLLEWDRGREWRRQDVGRGSETFPERNSTADYSVVATPLTVFFITTLFTVNVLVQAPGPKARCYVVYVTIAYGGNFEHRERLSNYFDGACASALRVSDFLSSSGTTARDR
ncbi:hypothetical protein K0M31_013661 [Melipona bicolor]|uniref:Uncharacterized protein n=1 Tax=Melipona bicolor TaxID=60889 RepID=A0AA40FHG9_9HYME|nr:hypothetical protein K0M31_013661 [Melipona bicolor]